jgi:phosphoenolpyruvate carboxylase
MTEQGETIAQKYGTVGQATYHLELLMAGTVEASLATASPPLDAEAEAVMGRLVAYSREAYEGLIGDPGFMAFFAAATPIDAIELIRIGSRPARRSGRRTLADLRAIPWVFSWSQARFNLPGWYGVGTALRRLAAEHPADFAYLAERLPTWPFLSYMLNNVDTSLATASPPLMAAYAELVPDVSVRARLLGIIEAEHARTREGLEGLFDRPLVERRPRLMHSLALREAPLAALHAQQIALLARWRAGAQADGEVLGQLMMTINAVAAGLRTTG